jgi:hypothetical protein
VVRQLCSDAARAHDVDLLRQRALARCARAGVVVPAQRQLQVLQVAVGHQLRPRGVKRPVRWAVHGQLRQLRPRTLLLLFLLPRRLPPARDTRTLLPLRCFRVRLTLLLVLPLLQHAPQAVKLHGGGGALRQVVLLPAAPHTVLAGGARFNSCHIPVLRTACGAGLE